MPLTHIGPFTYQRYAPRMPAGLAGRDEPGRHPVLIAGGGPVGMAVALGLARRGVGSVVIEADDSVCEGSRAACISRRSLEILDRLGVVARFMEKGLAWTRGRSFYGDREVFRFDMPTGEADKFPPMINLQQYYIEQYLLDEIAAVNRKRPGTIDFRWQSRITAVRQEADGVAVTVSNPLGDYDARRTGWWPATAARASCATAWAWNSKAWDTRGATPSSTSNCPASRPPSAGPGSIRPGRGAPRY